ncbi:GNAT family N-acetyltransferase [Sediminibacterium salmoneum]|jgi:ElaA protein|uniref:GNAT family N-acetyltransferase n=1 Tax=Sediminibacterium salmoneum TaxID=426421 RepID=UPI00047C2727|nr:GNAT family N-acetyltransferase [Sediminibacterium salmoneum]
MNPTTPFFSLKSFEELLPEELYAIIRLRNEVFVVEQNCVFQDADNKDQGSLHLMYWNRKELMAYCRLLPAGLAYKEMSIGRVVSSPLYRKTGAGRQLIKEAIDRMYKTFGSGPIRIGAQCYLIQFYASFGFEAEGEVYLEDGIEHIEMIMPTAVTQQ